MWYFLITVVVIPIVLDLILSRIHNRKKYSIAFVEQPKHVYSPHESGDLTISVSYKGSPSEKAVVIFSVEITNDGKEDIFYKNHFSGPVVMRTKHLQYINVVVRNPQSSSYPKVLLSEDGEAILSWDILKKKEKIIIDVVANAVDNDCLNSPESIQTDFEFRADCMDSFSKSGNIVEQLNKAKFFAYSGAVVIYAIMVSISSLTQTDIGLKLSLQGQEYHNAGVYYNAFTDQYYISSADKGKTKVLTEDLSNIVGSQPVPKSGHYLYINLGIILSFLVISIFCIYYYVVTYGNKGYFHKPIERDIE